MSDASEHSGPEAPFPEFRDGSVWVNADGQVVSGMAQARAVQGAHGSIPPSMIRWTDGEPGWARGHRSFSYADVDGIGVVTQGPVYRALHPEAAPVDHAAEQAGLYSPRQRDAMLLELRDTAAATVEAINAMTAAFRSFTDRLEAMAPRTDAEGNPLPGPMDRLVAAVETLNGQVETLPARIVGALDEQALAEQDAEDQEAYPAEADWSQGARTPQEAYRVMQSPEWIPPGGKDRDGA